MAELKGSNEPPTVGCVMGGGEPFVIAPLEGAAGGAGCEGEKGALPPDNSVRDTGCSHFGTVGMPL